MIELFQAVVRRRLAGVDVGLGGQGEGEGKLAGQGSAGVHESVLHVPLRGRHVLIEASAHAWRRGLFPCAARVGCAC